MQRALVIGYGSAGARHAESLAALGLDVAVVSRRGLEANRSYSDLAAALESEAPDYVTPEFVRLSIGIEDIEDIIADVDQALDASQR